MGHLFITEVCCWSTRYLSGEGAKQNNYPPLLPLFGRVQAAWTRSILQPPNAWVRVLIGIWSHVGHLTSAIYASLWCILTYNLCILCPGTDFHSSTYICSWLVSCAPHYKWPVLVSGIYSTARQKICCHHLGFRALGGLVPFLGVFFARSSCTAVACWMGPEPIGFGGERFGCYERVRKKI